MTLTSLERIRRAVTGQQPDCVPVAPYMGNHGAKVAGALIDEYCTNAKIMAAAQLKAWEIYRQDAVVAQSDNYYIAEGFGCLTEIRRDSTPTLKKPAVDDLGDIYKLKVPDPYKDGRMPVYLEATASLAAALKNEGVCVRGTGTGPFSLAGHLLGTERFLTELAEAEAEEDEARLAAFHTLLAATSDALIAFARALLAAGAHLVQCGDSLASINMISPKMYRKWAFPYEKKFFDAIRPACRQHGAFAILHICGNMTPVLEDMADTGADILELDTAVNLAAAKAAVGRRVCLLGNIHPTQILLQASPAEVTAACTQAIKDAAAGGRFILGSGCEVPPFAPRENLQAMVAAARNSRYPL